MWVVGVLAKVVKLPWYVWLGVVVIGLGWWHIRQDTRHIEEARLAGRAAVLDSAMAEDSAAIAQAIREIDAARERTDTGTRNAKRHMEALGQQSKAAVAAVRQLPASVGELPQVVALRAMVVRADMLVSEAGASLDSMSRLLDSERVAQRAAANVSAQQLVGARLVGIAQRDTIQELRKRPSWKQAAAIGSVMMVVGAAIGFLVGGG